MPSSTEGVPYVARGRDNYIVGHIFSEKHPGRPAANSVGAAVQTEGNRLFLFSSGMNDRKRAIIKAYDVELSKLEGRWSGPTKLRDERAFPAPGESWDGSKVIRVQSVVKPVQNLFVAEVWGAKKIFEAPTPYLIADSALHDIRKYYSDVLIDDRYRHIVSVDGHPDSPAGPKVTEAISKWVMDATPAVGWPQNGVTHSERLRAALGPLKRRALVVEELGAALDEISENGTTRSKEMADAVMATFREISFAGQDRIFHHLLAARSGMKEVLPEGLEL